MAVMIDKVFELLADKGFQEAQSGNLFFPAYIYTYPPEEEYELKKQIQLLIKKLERPNLYLNTLVINIYEEIIQYLKENFFTNQTLFDLILEKEEVDGTEAMDWAIEEINSDQFYDAFQSKLDSHFQENSNKKAYLVLYGFGSAFPILRASDFLKRTEKLIKDFKIIVFYPGEYADSQYRLFNILDDDNLYRANHLNRVIG